MKTDDTAKYLHSLTTLGKVLGELLDGTIAIRLDQRDSQHKSIPLEVVDITLQALNKNVDYWTECEIGLKLAKVIMNVEQLSRLFVQSGGLEQIYDIFLVDEVFSNIQVSALEVLL